jgi:hypothetical protein
MKTSSSPVLEPRAILAGRLPKVTVDKNSLSAIAFSSSVENDHGFLVKQSAGKFRADTGRVASVEGFATFAYETSGTGAAERNKRQV